MRLYAVYDGVAEEAGPVFCAVNNGVANRQYIKLMDQVPECDKGEYKLLYVGDYDTVTARVVGCDVPVIVDWRNIGIEKREDAS